MEPLVILSRVARVWRQLFVGHSLTGQTPPRDIAAMVSIPHWKVGAFTRACARFSETTLTRGFRVLVDADRTFKSASTERKLVLDLVLWKLLRSGAASR